MWQTLKGISNNLGYINQGRYYSCCSFFHRYTTKQTHFLQTLFQYLTIHSFPYTVRKYYTILLLQFTSLNLLIQHTPFLTLLIETYILLMLCTPSKHSNPHPFFEDVLAEPYWDVLRFWSRHMSCPVIKIGGLDGPIF